MPRDTNSSSPQKEIRVLEIVGCFLMFFAILLLIAVAGEKTVSGRVTNLVAALIILAVGLGMFWRGVVRRRGAWLLPVMLFGALAAASALVALCLSPSTLEARGAGYDALVVALKSAGWAMRNVVEGISLTWLKIVTAVGFALIAAVVWLVRRETVFEGVADRKWWRDLRLWTVAIMATQVIIYLLLGT